MTKPLYNVSIPVVNFCDPTRAEAAPVFKDPTPWSNSLYLEAYCFKPDCNVCPLAIIWSNDEFNVSTLS